MTFKKILSGSLAAAMLAGTLAAGSIVTHAEDENKFTDLAENGWYNDYVNFVYDISVMNGVSPTRFAPDEPLTRAMFATILGRYAREDE
ncbi:MAG: S-layer homology domain-containing protein, partial [Clostridiales bacterium]|nr:S-layer homology domain-containing protein [Clostridiales bacterium]